MTTVDQDKSGLGLGHTQKLLELCRRLNPPTDLPEGGEARVVYLPTTQRDNRERFAVGVRAGMFEGALTYRVQVIQANCPFERNVDRDFLTGAILIAGHEKAEIFGRKIQTRTAMRVADFLLTVIPGDQTDYKARRIDYRPNLATLPTIRGMELIGRAKRSSNIGTLTREIYLGAVNGVSYGYSQTT